MTVSRRTGSDPWIDRVAGGCAGFAAGVVGGWLLGWLVWYVVGEPTDELNLTPFLYGVGGSLLVGAFSAFIAAKPGARSQRK